MRIARFALVAAKRLQEHIRPVVIFCVALSFSWCVEGAKAQSQNSVLAFYNCSAFSTNPKELREFTAKVQVQLSKGTLTMERRTPRRPGRERLTGTLSRDGTIRLSGTGERDDGSAGWTVDLRGSLKGNGQTVLQGTLRGGWGKGKGTRRCELTFAVPTAELRTRLSTVFELEQRQDALEQQQDQTAAKLEATTTVLKDIILPVTEKPGDWMLRVSAVPVQQQQFCRIVDRFYDDLASVYLARNDLRRNALYRDRQNDLIGLLPGGKFENWVVAIKEVRQAPDGSAAVMLQPPCRAMLGSDACQANGSRITATVPLGSPMDRELENVGAGDFIVVSGKLLYAAQNPSAEGAPTRALYQAGSHCSTVDGVKDEDVFITEISSLARLK